VKIKLNSKIKSLENIRLNFITRRTLASSILAHPHITLGPQTSITINKRRTLLATKALTWSDPNATTQISNQTPTLSIRLSGAVNPTTNNIVWLRSGQPSTNNTVWLRSGQATLVGRCGVWWCTKEGGGEWWQTHCLHHHLCRHGYTHTALNLKDRVNNFYAKRKVFKF